MKVELIILIAENIEFCETPENLVSYLKSYSSFSFNNNKISIRNAVNNFVYQVKPVKFGNKSRYFNLTMMNELEDDSKAVEEFSSLISKIKDHFNAGSDKRVSVYAIWDDISYYYSRLAYPIINELENTMRKMILKFMIIGVGVDWYEKMTPTEIKQKVGNRNSNSSIFQNILWEMDFIHLSKFLFENYRSKNINELDKIVKSAIEKSIDVNLLQDFLPNNNWSRYFQSHIESTPQQLQSYWEELYDLRNKVAHNRGVTKNDYEKIRKYSELINTLSEAIEKIEAGSIILSEEQKEEIKVNIDNESLILSLLNDSCKWLKEQNKIRPNSFIGLSYFINKCIDRGVEKDRVVEIINKLEREGKIKVYTHYRSSLDYGITAIQVEL